MKRILIVGAGGFGRELYEWVLESQAQYPEWRIAGFLDDEEDILDGRNYDLGIISPVSDYSAKENEYLLMGRGSPKAKREIATNLQSRGAKFLTFIHKTALVGKNVTLGEGCIMCPYSVLTCDIEIGDFVTINCFSGAGHDVRIGSYSTLSAHVDITGYASIGEGVLLGSHASVLPKVKVEDDAVVGAGSVVLRTVKAGTTVFGNPASVVWERG
jgi:sugar O-acyltransferase (sialic acid O-acetyltransferase NeuD family)